MVSGVLNIPLLWHVKFHFRVYETRPISMNSYNMNFNLTNSAMLVMCHLLLCGNKELQNLKSK